MNHLGTKTLETERLILRRFTRNDAQDMFNNWAGDDEVTKYLTWPTHKDTGVSKAYIESRYDPRNPYSGKVMEKCGLKCEGLLKESDINNQGVCDAFWYALLRKDYYKNEFRLLIVSVYNIA